MEIYTVSPELWVISLQKVFSILRCVEIEVDGFDVLLCYGV